MGRNAQNGDRFFQNDEKRRKVLLALLPFFAKSKLDPAVLVRGRNTLIFKQDLDWLIDAYKIETAQNHKEIIASWISEVFDMNDVNQVEKVYYASKQDDVIGKRFESWFDAVDINSERANKLREWYVLPHQQNGNSSKADELSDNAVLMQNVEKALAKVENGDMLWWHLDYRIIMRGKSNEHYVSEIEPDLSSMLVWQLADFPLRQRILDAVQKYLESFHLGDFDRIERVLSFRPALAGYRGLILLVKHRFHELYTLSVSTWLNWLPAIFAYPDYHILEEDGLILKAAYQKVPAEFLKALNDQIDLENQRKEGFSIVRRIESCWDFGIERLLLEKLRDERPNIFLFRSILNALLAHGCKDGRQYAESLVEQVSLANQIDYFETSSIAAQMLLLMSPESWRIVWQALRDNSEFAHDVISGTAQQHRIGIKVNLGPTQLAEDRKSVV